MSYLDLRSAHVQEQTALLSSAGWQSRWADRRSVGSPPSVRPVAARTSHDPYGSLTSEGTSSPERAQKDCLMDLKFCAFTCVLCACVYVPDGRLVLGWCSPSCWWESGSAGSAGGVAAGRYWPRNTLGLSRTSLPHSWQYPTNMCAKRKTEMWAWKERRMKI